MNAEVGISNLLPRPVECQLRLMLIEDDDDHALLVSSVARRSLHPQPLVERVSSLKETWVMLAKSPPDLCLLDLGLPECHGLDTLALVFERVEDLPVIVLTSSSDLSLGEEAVRRGALDFLSKDEISERTLERSIRYAMERLARRRAAERSMRDLEGFAHAAAHDLKSPLNTIASMCSLIEKELRSGEVTESTLEIVGVLSESAQKAANLVDGLLRFSRLGRVSISPENVDLSELLAETVASLNDQATRLNAQIRVGPMPEVRCDRELISHVFQNLLTNGLKFSGKAPPHLRVSAKATENGVEICFADTGVGIDSENLERVFEPFERLGNKVDGSGLGLSICRRIVEAHNGRIWLESEVGVGSRFFVYLPR